MEIKTFDNLKQEKILIAGSAGQLGKAFKSELAQRNIIFFAPDEKDCNITQSDSIEKIIDSFEPSIVINCAAYNAVDDAESNQEIADLVNHKADKNMADSCKKRNCRIVHYGTDYVFNGKKEDLYKETDEPDPLNVYGKSKAAGELAVLDSGCKSLVLRTSWVYGDGTQNFIYKLLGWSEKNRILKISSDEASVPTSVKEMVKATLTLLEKNESGLFHLTNSNYCSRYEWCRFVIEVLGKNNIVIPVPMSYFKTAAKRASFTAMSNEKIQSVLGYDIPDWRTSVKEYLSSRA
jgi:dTDP-4-dehydrorhamnose reductase